MSTQPFVPQTRAQRQAAKRQARWATFRADMTDQARTEWDLAKARSADHEAAVATGEVDRWTGFSGPVHMLLTVLTGGLWAPVWIAIEIRNHRRWRRTSVGANDAVRTAEARRDLRDRQRDRGRAARAAHRR